MAHRGTIKSVKDIQDDWHIYDTVIYKGQKTTVGRVIFNSALPDDYPFVNKPVDKKLVNQILTDIFKNYGQDIYIRTLDKLISLGFKYATLAPKSISIDQLDPPPEILEAKKKLEKAKTPEEFDQIYKQLVKDLKKFLKQYGYDISDIAESGAGKWSQIAQILIAKGIVSDPKGNVSIVKSSFSDGLSPTQFFDASVGARSGVIDRALSTATTGYLTRRLVFACQSVVLGKTVDCKTDLTLGIKITKDMSNKIVGRYLSNGTLVDEDLAQKLVGKFVELRSPIYCKSEKICRTCYGKLADYIQTTKIGILAAQSIGERGTQLVMRTFHLGGAVSIVIPNIKDEIVKFAPDAADLVDKVFEQKDAKIYAKVPLTIILDREDYPSLASLSYDKASGELYVISVVGKVQPQDMEEFDLVIENPATFENVNFDGRYFSITVEPGQIAFELKASTDRFAQAVQKAINILEGRLPWKTPSDLLIKLYDLYKEQAPNIALVHYEVILSNLLRNKQDPYKPARLVRPYEPVLYGLKKVPYYDGSWLLGLAFENSKLAIQEGLLAQREKKELTPLEKVLLGV